MSLNQKMILILAMLTGGMFVGIAGALAEAYWLVAVGAALMVGSLLFFQFPYGCVELFLILAGFTQLRLQFAYSIGLGVQFAD